MTVPKDFSLFLHSEGKPLAEINPGSEEQALKPVAALQALELLAGSDVAILGGDVLSESSGKLAYTYKNCYCERLPGENASVFADRSRSVARQFVGRLIRGDVKNLRIVLVHTE
jgi:Immunity protein 40